jgi:hypothetical protein
MREERCMKRFLVYVAGAFLLAGCDTKQYTIVNVKDGGEDRVFLLNDSDGATWIWENGEWRRTIATKPVGKEDSKPFDKEEFIAAMLRFDELRKRLEALDGKLSELRKKGVGTGSREYLEVVADKIEAEEEMDRIRVSSDEIYEALADETGSDDTDFFGKPLR